MANKLITKLVDKTVEKANSEASEKYTYCKNKWIKEKGIDTSKGAFDVSQQYDKACKAGGDEFINNEYYVGKDDKLRTDITAAIKSGTGKEITLTDKQKAVKEVLNASSPNAVLRYAAKTLVNNKVDDMINDKIQAECKKYGIKSTKTITNAELREGIRNVIRGTKDSVFRNHELMGNLEADATSALEKYMEGQLGKYTSATYVDKALKPLKNAEDKLTNLDKKITSFSKLDKLEISKNIANQITGKLDFTSKLSGKLSKFGVKDSQLSALQNKLGLSINKSLQGHLNKSIEKNISKLTNVTKTIQKYEEQIKHYEEMVTKQIAVWQNKAKTWLKNQEKKWIGSLAKSFKIKL